MKTRAFGLLILLLLGSMAAWSQPVWTQKADYPGPARFDYAGFGLNGKGYIGGGRHAGAFNSMASWLSFDPVGNIWDTIAPMPYPYTGLSAFELGGYGFVVNGVNDAMFNYETLRYNAAGDNWATFASFPFTTLHSSSTANGAKGYLIGGMDMMPGPTYNCFEYDPVGDVWTQKASLPDTAARYYATAFSVQGDVFIFGGTNDMDVLNDLWKYDTATDTWTKRASMPAPGRQGSMAFVIDDVAYIVGGSPWSGANMKEVWKYTPATNTWAQLPDFPGSNAPTGGVGFTINGKGYITAGNATNECWEFTPETIPSSIEETMGLSLTLRPNPMSWEDKVFIEGLPEGRVEYRLFNSIGEWIQAGVVDRGQVVIDHRLCGRGLLMLELMQNGQRSATLKLMID